MTKSKVEVKIIPLVKHWETVGKGLWGQGITTSQSMICAGALRFEITFDPKVKPYENGTVPKYIWLNRNQGTNVSTAHMLNHRILVWERPGWRLFTCHRILIPELGGKEILHERLFPSLEWMPRRGEHQDNFCKINRVTPLDSPLIIPLRAGRGKNHETETKSLMNEHMVNEK